MGNVAKQSRGHSLVLWRESSEPERPALVFVPGFLSEQSTEQSMDSWTTQIVALAERFDVAAYGLYWPSQNLMRLLSSGPTKSLMYRFVAGDAVNLRTAALSVSGALGVGFSALWDEAIAAADDAAVHSERWLQELDQDGWRRPVILVGHSLGGRIVLKTAISGVSSRILRVFAMAPALRLERSQYGLLSDAISAVVLHSQHDRVLRYLFRVGQRTLKMPIGVCGVPEERSQDLRSIDVSLHNEAVVRHNSYAVLAESLLLRAIKECQFNSLCD